MAVFGKKQDNDQEDGDETPRASHDSGRAQTSREPTERTRLLNDHPPPSRNDGYLDPDDPAVSPYNLWTVRLMRYFTVLFLMLTFLWWVLLLVSIFVSPPGLNTRGSGFFDFSYTTLTAGNLALILIFFTAPSAAVRISMAVLALILLVDMIMILAIERLRTEESWPGIASIIWATVMAVWCVITDRVVSWGKREEEERLTGRAESRRTLREWLSVLTATVFLILYIVIAAFMTATLILRASDASLEYGGNRVSVDGDKYRIHIDCIGNATYDKLGHRNPTILLEAGEQPSEYDFEHWVYSSWQNGTIDRYCYWDRPGYAWSDNAPSPHSAGMSADALSEALAVEGEQGPWILVSAGYGSVVSRIFAARHIRSISGIMLIDPLHEDLLHRLSNPTRGFLLWAWGVISPLGIQRVLGAIFAGRTREDRVYGRFAYQGGKFIKAQLQENLVADSLTKNELVQSRAIQDQKTPLVLISSGISNGRDSEWARKQEDLSHLTDNLLSWDVVNRAPHEVWHNYDGRKIMERRLGQLMKAKSDAVPFSSAVESM